VEVLPDVHVALVWFAEEFGSHATVSILSGVSSSASLLISASTLSMLSVFLLDCLV